VASAPNSFPHVFELFAQGDMPLDRSEGGLGIGRALVKSLVELHGGEVEAHSAGPGLGSGFVVELPVSAREADRDGESANAAPSGIGAPA
jgi:signal transduction histidine kinase